MSDRLKALRDKRGKTVKEMRAILEKAETEKRDLTPEESHQHGKLFDEQDAMRLEVEAGERQQTLDRELAASAEAAERGGRAAAGAAAGAALDLATIPTRMHDYFSRVDMVAEAARMAVFQRYLPSGVITGAGSDEFRALQADVDIAAGFTVAPEMFVAQLIKFVDDMVFVRQHATVLPPMAMAQSLGIPSLDTDVSDADWTSELETGSEDTAMGFGKRELHPHPLAKQLKVSNKLLRASALNMEGIVRERLGYKFGVTEEKGYLTGSGALQPLGIYTASSAGISTARDFSTGNTAASPTFDGLKEAKYGLKPQYWGKARWNFHRDAVKLIDKLKDGEGRYIWQASTIEGQPDRILNFPVDMSEFTPNTFTTGLYVGALGDWSTYWIVDALAMQIQRLVELYAPTNQVGFIGRVETDGMPVLEEAWSRVKLG